MNRSRFVAASAAASVTLLLAACTKAPEQAAAPKAAAQVDATRLVNAAQDGKNWLSTGRTYDEQRHSPLTQVNDGNVAQLGLAWHHDLDAVNRGQQSTPIVVDGVMYVTTAWSKVFALYAKTGKLLWGYDPQVPGEWGINACCDVV
ncbi:MAG: hypothetical protein RLZZ393_2169, partial [Pseudomonadota bacterium]